MNILERLYSIGLSINKYIALKNQKRLPLRVVSVGNITLGGTGKTPAVIAIAQEAQKRGFRPVILTRGYRGNAHGPCFVTKGEGPLLTPGQSGDEPALMAERLEGVPIVKGADRYEAGMFALRESGIQDSVSGTSSSAVSDTRPPNPLFILDDGFQHLKLYRDLDILLINAEEPFGNRKLLPAGRLREPLTGLGRADIIMITKAKREDAGLIAEIRQYNNRAPIFFSEHRIVGVRTPAGQMKAPDSLRNNSVFCFCGLADPDAFRSTMAGSGASVAGMKIYRDHHLYTQQDLAQISKEAGFSGASFIVTTEKDWVKVRNLDLPPNILIIEIALSAGRQFFESVFS